MTGRKDTAFKYKAFTLLMLLKCHKQFGCKALLVTQHNGASVLNVIAAAIVQYFVIMCILNHRRRYQEMAIPGNGRGMGDYYRHIHYIHTIVSSQHFVPHARFPLTHNTGLILLRNWRLSPRKRWTHTEPH